MDCQAASTTAGPARPGCIVLVVVLVLVLESVSEARAKIDYENEDDDEDERREGKANPKLRGQTPGAETD